MKRKAGAYVRTAKRAATGLMAASKISKLFKSAKKRTKNRSRTRTKRIPFKAGVVQSTGHGISKSYSSKSRKPMKGLQYVKKTTNLDLFRIINTNVFISPTGRQAVGVHATINATRFKQLIQESIQTNAAAAAAYTQDLGDISREFWFLTYKSKCVYTNQGPNTIQLVIYDLFYKTDIMNQSPVSANPNTVWSEGLLQEGGIDRSQEVISWSSSRPEDCKYFRDLFTVAKRTEVEMHTGANHEHNFTFNYNGKLPMNKIEEMSGYANQGIKGISYVRMVVLRGLPTDDDAEWTDVTTVTRARAKVIAIDEQSFTSRLSSVKGRHIAYWNQLPNVLHSYNQNPDGQGIADTVTNIVDATKAFS